MGYILSLDEYTDEQIEKEYNRRLKCKKENLCFYCERPLNNGIPCKLNRHKNDRKENT